MYICVDFDGTIVDHDYPNIGKPAPQAIHYLKEWQRRGAKLILFTMRSGEKLDEAVEYLEGEGIKLVGVNTNPNQHNWTESPKAYGQIYVDDAAFGCPKIFPEGFKRPCVMWSVVGPSVCTTLEVAKKGNRNGRGKK